jgi:hypothetical protein
MKHYSLEEATVDIAYLVATEPDLLNDIPELSESETYRPAPIVSARILKLGELSHNGGKAAVLRQLWRAIDPRAGEATEGELLKILLDTLIRPWAAVAPATGTVRLDEGDLAGRPE